MPISALSLIPLSDAKRVKRANEEAYTLEKATEKKDYQYFLNDNDLVDIARIEYHEFKRIHSPGRGYQFCIVGDSQHLGREIESLQMMIDPLAKSQLTLLINLGHLHWVTLVLSHQQDSHVGYYVDSNGQPLAEQYRQLIENLASKPTIIDLSSQISQPYDDFNAGILALENAHALNQMIEREKPVAWVVAEFNRVRDTDYFLLKREYFSSRLKDDPFRKRKLQTFSERAEYIPSNVNNDEEKRKEVKVVPPEDSDLSEQKRANFFSAIKKGQITEVKKYLQEAYDQETLDDFLLAGDSSHKTALHLAAEYGKLDIVDYLIRQGGYPNVIDKNQKTPLHYAVENKNREIVLCLLKNHAHIDNQDSEGMSALHHAAQSGQIDLVQLLIEHGSDFKLKTKNKMTPLIFAAKNHHSITLRFLIDIDKNNEFYINNADKQGMTALLHLAKEQQWELFQYVVAHGGNINQADNTRKLPIAWVIEAHRFDIAQFMLEHDLDVALLNEDQKNKLLSYVIQSTLDRQTLQQNLYHVLYSTLRLNNVGLIKTLFDYLHYNDQTHSDLRLQIDSIIPKVYEELQLRKIPLSYKTSYYLENLILKSRFTSENTSENKKEVKIRLTDVFERIQMMSDFVGQLRNDYSAMDSEFLLKAQFIAQTIRQLKRTLRSTYHRLPWEEMEFCLVNFIVTYRHPETADFVSQLVIDQKSLLDYLKNFVDQLQIEKTHLTDKSLQSDFPKQADPNQSALKEARTAVILNNPLFESLYQDHEKIRTIYSLKKIELYLESALSIDLNEDPELGKLVIERTLQVIGENLKNTLQSPNVSEEIHQFLILFAPKYLREIVTSLRDSLSHAYLLKNKMTLEMEQDAHFFKKIQTDLKKIHLATTDMLYRNKVYIIKDFLKKVLNSHDFNEIKAAVKKLANLQLDEMSFENNINLLEKTKQKIMTLVDEVPHPTDVEKRLLDEVKEIILFNENKINRLKNYYVNTFSFLSDIIYNIIHSHDFGNIKQDIQRYLNNYVPELQPYSLQRIDNLLQEILHSLKARLIGETLDKIQKKIYKISYYIAYELDRINHITSFKLLLEKKESPSLGNSRQLLEQIFFTIEGRLISEVYKSNFRAEIEVKQKLYNNKVELKELFFQLEKQTLTPTDPLVTQHYQDLAQPLKKNLRKKLDKSFKDKNWPECIKIIENLRNAYQVLLESTLNSIEYEETFKVYRAIKDFVRSFDNKNLLKKINELIEVIVEENKKILQAQFFIRRSEVLENFLFDDIEHTELSEDLTKALEMVALDFFEMFEIHSMLADNSGFIDNDSPIVIGKALRNYLAHGDLFIALLPSKPDIAVVSNIFELFEHDIDLIEEQTILIGQPTKSNLATLKRQYDEKISVVINQNHFFLAAQQDNLPFILENYSRYTADIQARSLNGRNLLHFAAKGDALEVFKFALSQHLNIEYEDFEGQTPLSIAVDCGSVQVLTYLFDENKLTWLDINSKKLLHNAAENGRLSIVKLFVEHNANVNELDANKRSALHFAAFRGHLDVVSFLIEHLAELDALTIDKGSSLHAAASGGHLEVVRFLLQHHANVNACTQNNWTPLHYAAEQGHYPVVKLLIQYDAKVDALTRHHMSPLHYAAQKGHYSIVELLINHSALINVANNDDLLPLHLAAENGHSNIIKLLLAKMESLDSFSPKIKITALHVAAINGHTEVIQTLLADIKAKNPEMLAEFINAPDRNDRTALYLAASQGYTSLVKWLLAEGARIDIFNNQLITPLHLAVLEGHTEVIKTLLAHVRENYPEKDFSTFIDAQDKYYWSALHLAAYCGNNLMVKLLLDDGANIQLQAVHHGTALMIASGHGHSCVVETLLAYIKEKKPEKLFEFVNAIDRDDLTALHVAARQGYVKIMGLLLDQGALIDSLGPHKMTPLMLAATGGFSEAVDFLLANNAQVDASTEEKKRTALFFASKNGHMDVVKVLIAYVKEKKTAQIKPFINTSDTQGLTALHLASLNGHAELVAHLLMEGAEVNQQDQHKLTPIHLAAENGQAAVVKYLLAHGAEVNSKADNKLTPIHKATQQGYTRVIKILLNHGAHVDSLDNDKSTPLHLAAIKGDFFSIKLLLAHKAKKEIKNNAGKTPWDLAKEALERQPNHPELERSLRLLLGPHTQVETAFQQQNHYQVLSTFISQHFPTVKMTSVRQGLYLPSFAARKIKIDGQCAAITRAFSQSLFLSPTFGSPRDLHQCFLNNLQTSAELYERLAQGKQISLREEREVFALSHLLDDFKYGIDSSTSSLPARLSTMKHFSTLADFKKDMHTLTGDFALHLVSNNHVKAIYRKGNQYAYFDSNVAYVWGLKSISELTIILNQGIDTTSTMPSPPPFTVEYFNVAAANAQLSNKQQSILTKPLQTERFLLSQQDQQQGKINLQDKWLSRVELYDIGTKIQFIGETPKLINAAMDLNDERLRFYLSNNQLSLTATDTINHLRGEKVKLILRRTELIPIMGTRREVQLLKQLRQLINEDIHDQLKPAVINALLRTTPERALQTLSHHLGTSSTKKWPNRLTNAAGKVAQVHSAYSILQAALLDDKIGFALGVGEMGFSLFSQLIEDKIVKLTSFMIQRLKYGLALSRGVAGVMSSPFDIYDFIQASINVAHAVPYSKEWRDNIASAILSGGSLIVSVATTAAKKPGVGSVIAVGFIAIGGLYSGTSMVLEYKQYSLTTAQEFRLFMHTLAMQAPPEDVQFLEASQNLLNEIAENIIKHLKNSPISAYASGLGEIIFRDGENPCNIRQLRIVSSGRTRCTKKTPKIPTVVASPAKIMMGLTDHGNYRYFLSRIVTDKVLYNIAFPATCLPAFTGESFEYDDTLGKGWPLHRRSEQVTSYCENAIVIEDVSKKDHKKIVYDLDLIAGGTIVGRDNWYNTFLVGKEPNKIMGGEHASNLFMLSSLSFGEIWGGQNSTNILDLTQVSGVINVDDLPSNYDRKNVAQQRFQTENASIYGVTTWVISAGVTLHYLTQPVTVYVKPSSGSSHLHLVNATLIFTDTHLLKECDHFIYFPQENTLELKIKDFSLTLHNYFDQTQQNCHFKWVDQHGSVIEPLIDLSQTNDSQQIRLFTLKAEIDLEDKEIPDKYASLSSSKPNYYVFGEVINSATGSICLFGTQQSDMIPLNNEIRYAQAGEGDDAYYLTLSSRAFNAMLDNFAEDRLWDLLYLPLPIKDINAYKVGESLLLKHVDESIEILVKDYFFTSFNRHLIIMDSHQDSFIPLSNESGLSPLFIPFFRATTHKKFFLFPTEKITSRAKLMLATRFETLKFYREANHLLLLGDNALVVKLEAFYDHADQLSIGFWYDHQQHEILNPRQLQEFAKLAIDYESELISLHQDQIIEYIVDSEDCTIQHNQEECNPPVASIAKRFGILRFKQPTKVIVSKNQHDLLLFTDKSNVTLKNWSHLDFRISKIQFGVDDPYFTINKIEQFDLLQITQLQTLFNFAKLNHLALKQLNAINREVVNAIKFQLIIQGLENNYPTFGCLGFNSADDEQAFITLQLHSKIYHPHLRHDHAVNAVIWLFVLGYTNLLGQNQGNNEVTILCQCFKTLIGERLTDRLISKLEKQTTESGEHLESNLRRFIYSHHATIKEKLSIASASHSMPEAASATEGLRIRRDVNNDAIFRLPSPKMVANKPLLSHQQATSTPLSNGVSIEQNFIFTQWLLGFFFKQNSLVQRMKSIQKFSYQEAEETPSANIEKRFQSAITAFEHYQDDKFNRLIQEEPLVKKLGLRTQPNNPRFFGLAGLKSTIFGINTTSLELRSIGRRFIG